VITRFIQPFSFACLWQTGFVLHHNAFDGNILSLLTNFIHWILAFYGFFIWIYLIIFIFFKYKIYEYACLWRSIFYVYFYYRLLVIYFYGFCLYHQNTEFSSLPTQYKFVWKVKNCMKLWNQVSTNLFLPPIHIIIYNNLLWWFHNNTIWIHNNTTVCETKFCDIIDQSLFYIDLTTLYTKLWKFDIDQLDFT
jgi:hypothetical protein